MDSSHLTEEPPSGPTMSLVQSLWLEDGRRLCVRTWPGNCGRTVVFLHGLLDSSEGWAATCERRDGTDGRPTLTRIAFDIPGFGHSDAPEHGSIDGYAHDIAAGIRQLNIGRFTLVGHSLGGGVAARVAELMPDRVESLLLLAPVGFGRMHLAEVVTLPGLLGVVAIGTPHALSNRLIVSLGYRVMVANGKGPERELLERVLRGSSQVVDGARQGVRAIAAAGTEHGGFGHRRLSYDGPVIAVWGEKDRLVSPSHRMALKASLPQAHVEVWNGMGHHPQRERFEDLLRVIRRVANDDLTSPATYVDTESATA